MSLFELCVRRPVFATVLSLLLVLIGLVSYTRLTVREYPNIDEAVVSIQTDYPGASAEIVETQVTQPLENELAGIEGIDVLESSSRSEASRISVRFDYGVDPDVAANDVRDRVGRARGTLPEEIEEPVIRKVETDAQAILYIPFTSDRMAPLEITDYVDRFVLDRLQNLNGVAEADIYGERRYAMRIWIDRARLAAYDLTVQDVEDALRGQNVEVPSGRIESVDREFSVLADTGLVTADEFERIVLKDADGFLVRLGDVARAELGAEDERRESRYRGVNSVTVGIVKQATANPLDVSTAVRAALPGIVDSLPEGMNAAIGYDSSIFIERSISSVFTTIGEAVVLVVLVIFLFLRNLRATLIPIVTIPVSLIATFGIMYALGLSVNTLTLLAMVLAVGLVVDDAIVVLENVFRYIERGMRPVEAAIKGTREIGFAVIAMTLTLAAVYAPIAFAEGRTGRLFVEFALTLAGAVLVSGFVALTLSPMMCSKLLRHQASHGRVFLAMERFFEGMNRTYRATLTRTLKARPLVLLAGFAVAGGSVFLFGALPSELSPTEDRGVIQVYASGPEGATIEYTSRYMREVEAVMAGVPEVDGTVAVVGFPEVTNARSFSRLDDWEARERSQQEIIEDISPDLRRIPGIMAYANNPPAFGQRGSSRPIEYVIQTSGTYETLQEGVDRMLERAESFPGLTNVETDLELNKPQLEVEVDREKVADAGLQVEEVGRTLETMLGGRQVTRFEQDGEQYDVIVQLDDLDRSTPRDLSLIYVRGSEGEMIQLSNLVRVVETVAPQELNRFNQLRSAKIEANLAPGVSTGEGLAFLEQAADEVLSNDFSTDYDGQSREFREAGSSLYFIFALALGFIYLVLAAQFESFRDPFIIMLTVPLSMTGALLALYLTGGSINIYSQIGLVTLVGLITKHGILIVEFANQLQLEGKSRIDAVIEAATLRLRPILMTTGAMVLGAIPLALATGAGAESREQIGWVIVGGLCLGTLLTLFVVPTAYSLLARDRAAHPLEGDAPQAAMPVPAE